jgi:pyrroloquinoline quinone biosynthesis protein D
MTGPTDAARPYLPRGVRLKRCAVRDRWFLLGPERALQLDAVAVAIVEKLDGARDVRAVVRALAADFTAPEERIAADVRPFLATLVDRRLVDLR